MNTNNIIQDIYHIFSRMLLYLPKLMSALWWHVMVDSDTLSKVVFTLHTLQFVLHIVHINLFKENINQYNTNFIRRLHVLFTLFMFVCAEWWSTHIVLCFWFVFLRLVYPMLQVYLDCPFLIAPSIFSYVYSWMNLFLFFLFIFISNGDTYYQK